MAKLSDKVSQGVVPLHALTKRTKVVDITSEITVAGGTYTPQTSYAIFWADSNNKWFMDYDLHFYNGAAPASSITCTITGISLAAEGQRNYQAGSAVFADQGVALRDSLFCAYERSNNRFNLIASGTFDTCNTQGRLPLDSEPTAFITGNLENQIAIDAFIPEATSDTSGLLKSYSETSNDLTLVPSTWVLGSNNITAQCTKIGNRVFVDGRVTVNTGGSGYFRLINSELPFSVVQGSVGGSFYRDNGSVMGSAIAIVSSISSTEIQVRASALQTGTYSLNFNYRTTN